MTSIKKHNLTFLIDKTTNKHTWWVKTFSTWEDETFVVFDKILDKNKNFIDLGAWIGTTALYASLLSNHVYAVEPDPVSLLDLQKNVNINESKNVTIVPKAMLNCKSTICFGPSGKSAWNASTSKIKIKSNNKLDINITTITFQELIDMHSINNISLIKVDVEGAEEKIISDIFDYINKSEIKPSIYLSFHYDWWKNKNLNEYSHYWKSYNYLYYKLKLVSPDSITDIISNDPFGSILFTNIAQDFGK